MYTKYFVDKFKYRTSLVNTKIIWITWQNFMNSAGQTIKNVIFFSVVYDGNLLFSVTTIK